MIVCLSIVCLDGWRTFRARDVQLKEGERQANNLVRAIAQHAAATLKEADYVVMGLVDRLEVDGTDPIAIERVHSMLTRYASSMDQLQRLSVIGPDGKWMTTSLRQANQAVDVSERAYFRHHRDSPSPDAFVGPAIQTKSTGEWVVTVSRRFNGPDGRFGGVVLASISLDYFQAFYSGFDIGEHGTLLIALKDGQLLERRPRRPDLVGTSLANTELYRKHVSRASEGFVQQRSSIDQLERQIAFINLDEFPIYVVASLAMSETLAPWTDDAIVHTGFVAVLVAVLGMCGFWLVSQIRHRAVASQQLKASQDDLAVLNAQLAAMATSDGLTGLANRRALDRSLVDEVARGHRLRTGLGVILLDVDCFKSYNDQYGHVAGDSCLQRIAEVLHRNACRPGDVAARYGGEEFAIVCPGADLKGTIAVGERICSAVLALGIPHAGNPRGVVTISAGVAILDPSSEDGAKQLLEGADEALYAAKRSGKNTVRIAPSTKLAMPEAEAVTA